MPTVMHLTSSTFFGGPERQMLGLARSLPASIRTVFVSFPEGGRCGAFLDEVRRHGFDAFALKYDSPRVVAAVSELTGLLRRSGAAVLLCHGYKAILLGRVAARMCGVPAVAVSRGWTGESWKVRLYETLERISLRWMDRVVCVSRGQADKVRLIGVGERRLRIIPNAIRADRFRETIDSARRRLMGHFARPPRLIVGAAGRLSPEKGFGVLVEAATRIDDDSIGFLLFGDGPLRETIEKRITADGLEGRFVLGGFRSDLDALLPGFDVLVLPSFTEGLPNVVLEASAAGVPVVATAVGGTPEVVVDGESGRLVPPGDAAALADAIRDVLGSESRRRAMGEAGRRRVTHNFGFEAQAAAYRDLFEELSAA